MKQVIIFALLIIVPALAYYTFQNDFGDFFKGQNTYPVSILVISIYSLSIWLFFFHAFVDYYLDVWIVTNQRIINIEQKGLFSRIVSEQKLNRVQDITSEVHGIWATMMHFGTVYIQTAGEEPRFVFKQIPHPYDVRKVVNTLAEKYRKQHPNGT